ncbi:glucokinase [Stackebrandtia endophytica]|uniref:Glucokinase n=1 Tax=Stackebrandtia endophytica TaxID=1496996 RepID=A0A543AWQ3_9ACTN|nr:ROK family protein [Stackebrandtia endophytica]TQL77003.1 glucokinase [Stackebrandtia endophytica]
MTEVVVALDVGGTSIKCALVDRAGKVLLTRRVPTGRDRGPDAVVETILSTAAELTAVDGYTPRAVGLVVPGVINSADGIAVYASNLGWRDVPFRRLAEAELGLPTALGHDVRAGGLAEARLGGGRGSRQLLFVAIGTGIAGAHFIDGAAMPGAHGSACELGHVVVRPDGPLCGCGQRGCVESVASAVTFERRYAEAAGRDLDAAAIIAAIDDDPVAARIWTETVDVLADGLLVGMAMLDPDTIVLGGGLAEAGERLLEPLRDRLTARATFHTVPRLVNAELGDTAGCVGAALLGLERLDEVAEPGDRVR